MSVSSGRQRQSEECWLTQACPRSLHRQDCKVGEKSARGWSNKYNIYVWEQPLVGSGSFNNVGSTALYRQHDCNVECKDDLDLGVTQAMRSIKESGIQ